MSNKQAFGALSDRQAAFAVAYARHHNASQAAREAGYAQGCASVTGTGLLANANVVERVRELEAQTAFDVGKSRERLLIELQNAATLAKEKREPMAMIATLPRLTDLMESTVVRLGRVDQSSLAPL